ncbi:hypothetical protein FRC08_003978 [Ceratobasidium sp. 394]|nr:hypothetical protein FRC08_003978 [Ceratobasidium sp. 394]
MSTGPGFTRPTSSSSSRVIGALDTEGQDCARVRPPAETPKRPSRTLSRPSTPVRRPSTPTKPLDQSSGIPIPRAGTRKYTLTRKSSSSSLVGTSSPSKFILPPRPSSPAVTNRVSASGHIASSPDSILDDSVLHAEPEIMSTITATVTDKDKTKTGEGKSILSRKSTKLAQGRDEADKEVPKPEPIGAPQQAVNDPALPSQSNKNEAEAKIVGPKTSNETRVAQAAPEPEKPKAGQAAHRYDINDELVPDIVVYKLPGPGQGPKWKIVYEGQPGVDSPAGVPSEQNWENARKRMEDVCARHKDQSPQWAVLAIGSWARIYTFVAGKLIGTMCTGGVLAPNPVPYKPDPDPNTSICVSFSMGDVPAFPYAVALQGALKMIFV